MPLTDKYKSCSLCPRLCGADRTAGQRGFCGMGGAPTVARAAPHFGEEPCISGTRGSGAVFFTGCGLGCVYCQNREISLERRGKTVTVPELEKIFLRLQAQGVHNINLVTATHFAPSVARALERARPDIPVVWNSSGYERPETLRMLEGLVDVYMPDLKYADCRRAARYSSAADYPESARAAIREMFRQTGPCRFDGDGLLQRGVLIRHLLLPGGLEDTLDVIDFVSSAFPGDSVLFSLMAQFLPLAGSEKFPELNSRVTHSEYNRALEYARLCGIRSGYRQEPESATAELVPDFDLTGV